MKLKSVEIKNFRCFESLTIDLDEQLTVLVAENGAGKTTILDAIAVAISPFVGGFDTGVSKGFKSEDARLASDVKLTDDNSFLFEILPRYSRMEFQYPISLIANGIIDGQFERWSRELTGEKTQTTFGKAKILTNYAKKLQQQVRLNETISLPIIAYYGTERLLKQKKATNKNSVKSQSRLYGYHDALNPNTNYKSFEKWFIDMSIAQYINESRAREMIAREAGKILGKEIPPIKAAYNPALTPFGFKELRFVQQAIDQCLSISKWYSLEYDPNWRALTLINNESKTFIPVSQLSDGVKAMLTLTADIAYRCVQLNPHLVSPCEETNGIVLIDEVDLHLHPKWQQTVLRDLQIAFPSIQFIVTTHSPQVLSSVHRKSIRLLGKDSEGRDVAAIPLAESYGEMNSDVLQSVMHVNPQPPVVEKAKLERLIALVDQALYDTQEAMDLLAELKTVLGETHPQLEKIARSIRRQAMLKL